MKNNDILKGFLVLLIVALVACTIIALLLHKLDIPGNLETEDIFEVDEVSKSTAKIIPEENKTNLKPYDIKKEKNSIKGKIKNTTKDPIDFIQISVLFYNEKNERVANDFNIIENLQPGEIANFEFFVFVKYKEIKFEVTEDMFE